MPTHRLLKVATLLFSGTLMAGFVAWRGGLLTSGNEQPHEALSSHNGGPLAAADTLPFRTDTTRVLWSSSKSMALPPPELNPQLIKFKPAYQQQRRKRTVSPSSKSLVLTQDLKPETKLADSTRRKIIENEKRKATVPVLKKRGS